jgi:hypothetical protein
MQYKNGNYDTNGTDEVDVTDRTVLTEIHFVKQNAIVGLVC